MQSKLVTASGVPARLATFRAALAAIDSSAKSEFLQAPEKMPVGSSPICGEYPTLMLPLLETRL
jgi:hypothetical protein